MLVYMKGEKYKKEIQERRCMFFFFKSLLMPFFQHLCFLLAGVFIEMPHMPLFVVWF